VASLNPSKKRVAIVLASGVSRRFGPKNKLTTLLKGKSIIEKTTEALEQSNIEEIVTVIGHQGGRIQRVLQNHDTIFIKNPVYAKGMGTSIHAGIASLKGDVGAALIVLGDMPFVAPETINLLLEAHENSKEHLIFVPTYKGERGNPVLWDNALFPELLKLAPGLGGKQLIIDHPEFVKEVNVSDRGILVDIDSQHDID